MSQSDRPKPFAPHGAVDGIVCNTELAKKMSFIARFGRSCGTAFNKDEFCKKHIQYENLCPYLKDRPSEPWTKFESYHYDKKKNKKQLMKTEKDVKKHKKTTNNKSVKQRKTKHSKTVKNK